MNNIILQIKNLNASIEKKNLITDFNLEVKENEIHVIIGPNGCGKSTISKILAGHSSYKVQKGSIFFYNKNLLEISPEDRSHEGIFLAFQYPIEISGLTNYDFLRIAYNEKQKYLNKKLLGPIEFMGLILPILFKLKIKNEFLNRNLNESFSGGEKKRNEILQMLLLKPKLIILDEIDSGLDMDTLKIICNSIQNCRIKNSSLIIITHYPLILKYLKPTYVHVMAQGALIKTGNLEILKEIEKRGFESFN